MICQPLVTKYVAASGVNTEERQPVAVWLYAHQRRRTVIVRLLVQEARQFLDSGSLKQRSQRQMLTKARLDSSHQPHSEQRVSAQTEEVITNANRPDV